MNKKHVAVFSIIGLATYLLSTQAKSIETKNILRGASFMATATSLWIASNQK